MNVQTLATYVGASGIWALMASFGHDWMALAAAVISAATLGFGVVGFALERQP